MYAYMYDNVVTCVFVCDYSYFKSYIGNIYSINRYTYLGILNYICIKLNIIYYGYTS